MSSISTKSSGASPTHITPSFSGKHVAGGQESFTDWNLNGNRFYFRDYIIPSNIEYCPQSVSYAHIEGHLSQPFETHLSANSISG
jgi:hypothetical protein